VRVCVCVKMECSPNVHMIVQVYIIDTIGV
jgi:hypothetical protein